MSFEPANYPASLQPLLETAGLNPLGPGRPADAQVARLRALDLPAALAQPAAGNTAQPAASKTAPHRICDESMAHACLAGLYLLHDDLDASHRISQDLDTATGSYWHGLMHRREPDYDNAKYWFRRVGRHPVFESLVEDARSLAQQNEARRGADFLLTQRDWNPYDFIDLCSQVAAGRSDAETLCRAIQRREWELLFDYSYRHAVEPA